MNSHQAKKVPLFRILNQLGHQPHHQHRNELLYFSPFRKETEPSFSINMEKNIWHDFGEGKGGNVLDFIMAYYGINNISSGLRQLQTLIGQQRIEPSHPPTATHPPISSLAVRTIQPLQNQALTKYLKKRGISRATARPYVKEIYYTRKAKSYFSLAFLNQSGGYELRNPYFKGVHGTKDITIINGDLLAKRKGEVEIAAVTVFEGFIDFLSALTYYGKDITTAVIVLNSVTMKHRAVETIKEMGVGKVYLYLDRDPSGRELTQYFLQHLHGVTIVDNSDLYADYKDFNDFLVKAHPKPPSFSFS